MQIREGVNGGDIVTVLERKQGEKNNGRREETRGRGERVANGESRRRSPAPNESNSRFGLGLGLEREGLDFREKVLF